MVVVIPPWGTYSKLPSAASCRVPLSTSLTSANTLPPASDSWSFKATLPASVLSCATVKSLRGTTKLRSPPPRMTRSPSTATSKPNAIAATAPVPAATVLQTVRNVDGVFDVERVTA